MYCIQCFLLSLCVTWSKSPEHITLLQLRPVCLQTRTYKNYCKPMALSVHLLELGWFKVELHLETVWVSCFAPHQNVQLLWTHLPKQHTKLYIIDDTLQRGSFKSILQCLNNIQPKITIHICLKKKKALWMK